MNPFQLLEISPTKDKLKIRRAYVRMTKKHHPDQGGKAGALEEIQAAYNMLVKNDYQPPTIRSEIKLNAIDLLTGCNTTAIIGKDQKIVVFDVPAFTYPGSLIEFYSKEGTRIIIRINVGCADHFTLLDSNIITKAKINTIEAYAGIDIPIVNFDGNTYTIKIPPYTTASKLIYNIENAGFFEKDSQARGDLKVIVDVTNKR
jgi:DnaJ-class molecular chaperone